ncbi:hypothetical protein C8R45DRAFT_933676 [Mycena sanguinolenta]|nr:hypothetical protein C8R45DRAFT_933676 [Mycena sanguinolenta]
MQFFRAYHVRSCSLCNTLVFYYLSPQPVPDPPPTSAKRAFDEISASWGDVAPMPRANKKAKREAMDTKSPLDKLISMAKFCPRAANPYMDIGSALHHGASNDKSKWGQMVAKFRKAAADAGQSDTHGLKHKLHYRPSDPMKPLIPAISSGESKSDRGTNHPHQGKPPSKFFDKISLPSKIL